MKPCGRWIFLAGAVTAVAARLDAADAPTRAIPSKPPAAASRGTAERDLFLSLQGRPIRGTHGEKLGEIADLIVDFGGAEIPYVLVASAAGPEAGYRLRLVPTAAMQRAERGDAFLVPFDDAKWRSLESIDARELKAGALAAFQAHRQEIAAIFGLRSADAAPARLVLATDLRGRTLRNDQETLGRVEGILAAPDQRTAMALVRSARTGAVQSFLVPVGRLQLASMKADHFNTALTRQDLETGYALHIDVTAALWAMTELDRIMAMADVSQSSVSGPTGYANAGTEPGPAPTPASDGGLTPTGRSSAQMMNERAETALAAIRQTLVADASLAGADFQVEIERGRIVLAGTVADDAMRRRIEERARAAAPAAAIENRIVVKP